MGRRREAMWIEEGMALTRAMGKIPSMIYVIIMLGLGSQLGLDEEEGRRDEPGFRGGRGWGGLNPGSRPAGDRTSRIRSGSASSVRKKSIVSFVRVGEMSLERRRTLPGVLEARTLLAPKRAFRRLLFPTLG